jgi:hypothetical protein
VLVTGMSLQAALLAAALTSSAGDKDASAIRASPSVME